MSIRQSQFDRAWAAYRATPAILPDRAALCAALEAVAADFWDEGFDGGLSYYARTEDGDDPSPDNPYRETGAEHGRR